MSGSLEKKKTIRHLLVTGKAAFWNVFSQQFSSVLSEFTAASHPALLIKEEARLAKSKPNCSSTVNQPSSVTLIYHLNASWGHSVLSSYSSLLEPLWDWFQATDYYCKNCRKHMNLNIGNWLFWNRWNLLNSWHSHFSTFGVNEQVSVW